MSKNPNYTGGERFNKLSKKDGYRSRAAYKLKQINKSHNLIKQNQNILDIGCAPGSWIQVVKELSQGKASITGIDIASMAKIEGITFLQKDLLEVKHDDLNDHLKSIGLGSQRRVGPSGRAQRSDEQRNQRARQGTTRGTNDEGG